MRELKALDQVAYVRFHPSIEALGTSQNLLVRSRNYRMNEFSDLERLAMRRALLIAMGGLYSQVKILVWVHVSSEMVRFFQKDFIVRLVTARGN